ASISDAGSVTRIHPCPTASTGHAEYCPFWNIAAEAGCTSSPFHETPIEDTLSVFGTAPDSRKSIRLASLIFPPRAISGRKSNSRISPRPASLTVASARDSSIAEEATATEQHRTIDASFRTPTCSHTRGPTFFHPL